MTVPSRTSTARLSAARWPAAGTVDDWSQGTPLAARPRSCVATGATPTTGRPGPHCSIATRNSEPRSRVWESTSSTSDPRNRGAAPPPHSWMARFHCGVSRSDRSTHRSGRPWRSPGGRIRCGLPVAPGVRLERCADRDGVGNEQGLLSAWAIAHGTLGYARYGAQGGDWGAMVTTALGVWTPTIWSEST